MLDPEPSKTEMHWRDFGREDRNTRPQAHSCGTAQNPAAQFDESLGQVESREDRMG